MKIGWRWRESNPRPPVSRWDFSERIRRWCLGSRHATGAGAGPQPTEMSMTARRRRRSGKPCKMTPGAGPQD